jgi:hypothetical protein
LLTVWRQTKADNKSINHLVSGKLKSAIREHRKTVTAQRFVLSIVPPPDKIVVMSGGPRSGKDTNNNTSTRQQEQETAAQ